MGRILAFVNQKGGVGKTTSAVNLAAALQKAGKKVLLCDFDPQANATSGLGVEKSAAAHSTYELVIDGFPAADAVIHTPYCDVLASNVALSGAGVELVGMDAREYALKHALEPLRAQYDYILIDCPPSLELLTLNALCAATQVLIPVQFEYYALESLSDLKGTATAMSAATIIDYLLDRMKMEEKLPAGAVKNVEIRQIPLRLQMLLAGKVETALLPEPLVTVVEKKVG